MISFGKNIRQANDPLNRIELEAVYHKIRNPQSELKSFIKNIRTVATIDTKKYRLLKVKLPYLVAALFKPGFRKKDNFAYTLYFILDIDHVNEKELNLNIVFNKIIKDPQVVFAFRSPSNDGIKVFFKLDQKCYDAGKYSKFYKYFAQKFSQTYGLNQVIDKTTSDVSRACFVSYDPDAYFNINAEAVIINNYIDFENEEELFAIQKDINETEEKIKESQPENKTTIQTDIDAQDLPIDLLQKIREKLNPKIKEKREKKIIVPEELENIEELIQKTMKKYQIEIVSVKKINYGKQIKFKYQHYWSELNIFYGKRGYTIVKSTKRGSNTDVGETCYSILADLLY